MTIPPLFQKVELALTVGQISQLPPPGAGEIAFAGRSNAGKSSAINTLVERKGLAFVAKTPGKTRTIQFYSIGDAGFLVDLPGYGYAKVSEVQRRQWHRLLEEYLTTRASLRALVLIMDIRHPLTPLDRQMLAWFAPRGLPVHILLTKSDKLSRGDAKSTLLQVRAELAANFPMGSAQLFSSLHRTGTEDARAVIADWLGVVLESPRPQPRATVGGRK